MYHLRVESLKDVFKPDASVAASEFCKLVQVGIDVCIPYRKYQVTPHLSLWFSALCTTAITY